MVDEKVRIKHSVKPSSPCRFTQSYMGEPYPTSTATYANPARLLHLARSNRSPLARAIGSNAGLSVQPEALKHKTIALIKAKGLKPETILSRARANEAVADQMFINRAEGVNGKGATLAPVAAVLGGIVSQDILNSIGGRELPVVNWMFLTQEGAAEVVRIGEVEAPVVVD